MAGKDQVLVELQIIQKGDKLSVLAKDTEKLSKAQTKQAKSATKVGKSSEEVIKGQKGIHQSGLSSSKGFSKMNQMLNGGGGSSGLVAAYATLAANVFAATAAFNAFRSAAAFEQLAAGFTFMANQAGITMSLVVERLKEVTNGALSTEEALQGASLAVSAGFPIDKLETLAKVAKGASLALGRNLGDAFDRLTRGAIKLEPEILDELGIMVRLDDATEKYAASINKTAGELTQFERQTAFLNAINEQGIKKYGELADALDTNPYDKLAAAFGDLTKEFLSLINVGLIPIITFFSQSKSGLIGITALFASTIVTTMIPALGQMVVKAKAAAAANLLLAKQAKATANTQVMTAATIIQTEGKQTKTIKDMAKAIAARSGLKKQAGITEKNLIAQLARAEAAKAKLDKKNDAERFAAKEARIAQINREIAAVRVLAGAELTQLTTGLALDKARVIAKTSMVVARHMELIGALGAGAGFKQVLKGIGKLKGMLFGAGFAGKKAAKSMGILARVWTLLAGSAQLLGTFLLGMLPWIAGIVIAVSAAVFIFKKLTAEMDLNSKGIAMLETTTEALKDKFAQLNKEIATLDFGATRIRQYKQTAGVFQEIAGGINQVLTEISEADDKLENLGSRPVLPSGYSSMSFMERAKAREDRKPKLKAWEGASARAQGLREEGLVQAKASITEIVKDTTLASELASKKLIDAFDGVENKTQLLAFVEKLNGEEGFTLLAETMSGVEDETTKTATSILNLGKAIGESEEIFSNFLQKAVTKTEFDGVVKQFQNLSKEMKIITDDPDAGVAVLTKLFEESGEQMKKFGIDTTNVTTRLPLLQGKFEKLQEKARTLKDSLKQLAAEATSLSAFKDVGSFGMEAYLKKQQEAITKQQEFNDAQREIYGAADMKDTQAGKDMLLQLDASDAALVSQLKTAREISAEGNVVRRKVEEKIASALNKQALSLAKQQKSQEQINNLLAGRTSKLTPAQEYKFKVSAAKAELAAAKKTRDVKNNVIDAERALMMAKADADYEAGRISISTWAKVYTASRTLANAQKKANSADIDAKQKALNLIQAQGIESTDMYTAASAMFRELGGGADHFGAKLQIINTQMQPFLESLRQLGPEGEAMAGAQQAFFNLALAVSDFKNRIAELSEQFTETFDNHEKMGDFLDKIGMSPEKFAKTIAAMEIMSSVLGSMMANLKAQTAQQVAAIDRQIEAEKRADGSSAASIAKIAAMDKKKEAIERKAFERNKKLQVAQTVINTATAAMMAFGMFGPIVGGILAAMILSVGKKQIDIIKATQFDGGGQAPSMSEISVGKRDNKVDVSQGATAGETSYLRGNQGIGSNANNFVPGGAAGMRRGYANGGEILVGERGPEVIKPTADGYSVIPNDKLGGTSNVNFTINAVDAAGVEEVLVAQRGHIIGMIREAANEHGEEFMEGVNTEAYGGG